LGVLAGCSAKKGPTIDPNAFAAAPPEIKQAWDEASAADRTNGYAPAQTLYFALMREKLTPQQRQAVEQASTALNDRFTAALQKGDPAAQAALAELRAHPPNRSR
jgi:hypothetical protein